MDGARVFRDYSNGQSSTYLVRAICLVTCKTKQAAPFLRLSDDGPLLKPREFASKLLIGLDAAIKANLEPDRVTKIQILALMHLHNDGLAGMDRSSAYLSQAISEAWAISLHFKIPGNTDQDQSDMLWWSLRNLDRLNKVVMGAGPFMIDDTDIAIERIVPRISNYRSQIFGVTLALGDLMATATKIYKASSKATSDDCQTFPSLSELTPGINLDRFHKSHRRYLEIWYHIAAMLSCRYSGPGSVQYNRRLNSADCVLDIISHGGHESLPPLPLVPYAMSMSTTMIYRALRDNQRDVDAAYRDLSFCYETLDALSLNWTSAKGVAKVTRRILNVFTNSRTLSGQPGDDNEHASRRSRPHAGTVTADRTSTIIHQRNDEAINLEEEATVPTRGSVQTNQTLDEEQAPDSNQNFQTDQPIDEWPGTGASFSQFDKAFHDLYDYGMPNVFWGPTTWEFLRIANDEEGSSASNELQLSSYFERPEQEIGYDHFSVNSAQGTG